MNDIKFKTLEDLYIRILPALKTKVHELQKLHYNYIKEEDIWNYLRITKWTSSYDLDLSIMVNDILNIDLKELENYMFERRIKHGN